MAKGQSGVLQQIGTLFTTGSVVGVPDIQLLERFVLRRDEGAEAAFAALVARHGPMVQKLCTDILRDCHEAEDAFQATFMLLAAKAPRIRNGELLGNWLYGVALRTAMKARTRAARRRRHERRAANWSGQPRVHDDDFELYRALHEGISALPPKYRTAIVLCHLEGMTREQAAALLDCPVSTVGVRLMRARERLRAWLTRRHQYCSAGVVLAGLDSWKSGIVPSSLVEATTGAASRFRPGIAKTNLATSASIELMKEVQMSLILSKLKIVGTSLLVCVLFTAGIVSMAEPQKSATPERSAEQEVLGLERAWGKALVNRDAATMDRIVAYEMIGTDPAGHLWNKADYLEAVKAGVFKVESFDVADVKVHVYGDAAVAIGLGIINAHSKSGFGRGAVRSTDTYVRRNGCWQCVAWHALGVADLAVTHASRPEELPKSAELPIRPFQPGWLSDIPFESFKPAETKAAPSALERPKTSAYSEATNRAEPKSAASTTEPSKTAPYSPEVKRAEPKAASKPSD
jgi:RNA polymerase sigma factor (sigma-70 family)